jgi:importin subunit alpha-6/7
MHLTSTLGVNIEDGRRRREQNVCAIRKDKKEEGLAKRRNLGEVANQENEHTELATFGAELNTAAKRVYTVADIPTLLAGLQSPEVSVQVDCVRGFRRLLSLEKHAPVKQCINCGAVPFFVQFLQRHENTELQFEAAWVLTNIASSEETEVIVKYDAIPHLVNLLLSPNADIREQVRSAEI